VTKGASLKFIAISVSVLVFLAAPTQAETGFLDRSVLIGGETYRYQVYVPADYTPQRKWPVIVALHGDGSQGSDGLLQTTRGLAEQIRQRRSQFPTIVVFPQARVGTRFMAPAAMQDLVIAQMDQAVAEFNGDVARLYLTGYSMGGGSVYRIAYRWPQRFAALVVIAGPIVPEPGRAPAAMVELDKQTNRFAAAPDPFAALAEAIVQIPIWICHGDADQTPPVDQARHLVEALKKVGATYRYTELPGADHAASAQKGYGDPELIGWLLQQHR
jgi:predicted peptidase